MAFRVSWTVIFTGFSPSSTRPVNRSLRSASNTKTWGVATGPYLWATTWVSPS